jgi:hypothetical protein
MQTGAADPHERPSACVSHAWERGFARVPQWADRDLDLSSRVEWAGQGRRKRPHGSCVIEE